MFRSATEKKMEKVTFSEKMVKNLKIKISKKKEKKLSSKT